MIILVFMFILYVILFLISSKNNQVSNYKIYHYVFNTISIVILVVAWITPVNPWIGYIIACIVLIVKLIVMECLGKKKND